MNRGLTDSFAVKETAQGTTLAEVLSSGGPVPVFTAAEIAADIASALTTAHQQGIVHDDLEPTDIIITPSGHAKIIGSGVIAGFGVGPDGDLPSLGLVLLQMVGEGIPTGLSSIIERLLSTDPSASYPSAEAAEADLRKFVDIYAGMNGHSVRSRTGETKVVGVNQPQADQEFEDDLVSSPVFLITLATLLVLLIGLILYLSAAISGPSQDSGTDAVKVPTVIGDSQVLAIQRLQDAGFIVEEVLVESDQINPGTVFAQDPAPRTGMEAGSKIVISIAQAPSTVAVPDVLDAVHTEASAELSALGLAVRIQRQPSEVIEIDRVVGQSLPGGQQVAEGADITLFVSSGPEEAIIPDLAGMTVDQAQSELDALGFWTVRVEFEPNPAVAKDNVIRTEPAPDGQIELTTPIVLVVSTANHDFVPSVVGQGREAALQMMWARGFSVSIDWVDVDSDSGQVETVISQSPEAEALLPVGTVITLRVGREPGFFSWWPGRGRGD